MINIARIPGDVSYFESTGLWNVLQEIKLLAGFW